ncbi:MAG: VOC family protein [Planctomycetes bacterium]|nr:VOC family protein [Planctomycetota bacterium]MBI3843140.1 VOC family protein [Planctomycetota bacterium]
MSNSIDERTRVGPVHLTVRDLSRSIAFYEERIGLRVNRREGSTARLGVTGGDLLALLEDRAARPASGTTGLYHFALLVPSRRDLARALAELVRTRTAMTGAADHGVSEALYLSDPDENGIEIYRDRPRDEWPLEHGRLAMGTDPLDLEDVLSELSRDDEHRSGLAAGTTIGHVHLHVADLTAARRFYVDGLGFELRQQWGTSALFVAAGGYHHHIGLNTWQGVGAPPPPPGSTGLRHFEIRVADRAEFERVVGRLRAIGVAIEARGDSAPFRDPSQNGIALTIDATLAHP